MKKMSGKKVVYLKEEELKEVIKEYVKELKSSGVIGEGVSEQEWKRLLYGLWSGLVYGNRVDGIIVEAKGSRIEVNDCFAFVRVVEWLFGGVDEIVREN